MKRNTILTMSMITIVTLLTACTSTNKEKVVIYSSAEDYRNEHYSSRLKEEFPQYDIVLEYMPTGNHGAKLKAEQGNSECDITLDLEYGYLDSIKDYLATLDSYDTSMFADDLVSSSKKYLPEVRSSGCVIINTELLSEKGLSAPKSYYDLLDPQYKGLISMPNPKTSGTGYMFLKSLVDNWGEEAAYSYFDKLSENILQYTSSGSGPVNSLLQGEVVIGLGMTAQAVTEINKGAPFEIVFFEEGAPYSCFGYGIIKGKENNKAVQDVFDFLNSTLIRENNKLYFPELIYKDEQYEINNYPKNIKYSILVNNTAEERERLLSKWEH